MPKVDMDITYMYGMGTRAALADGWYAITFRVTYPTVALDDGVIVRFVFDADDAVRALEYLHRSKGLKLANRPHSVVHGERLVTTWQVQEIDSAETKIIKSYCVLRVDAIETTSAPAATISTAGVPVFP